jgi:hypothetical protein
MRLHSSKRTRFFSAPLLTTAAASLVLGSCAASQEQASTARVWPYFAIDSGDRAIAMDDERNGFFAESKGCVVFKPADGPRLMTPIFPKGGTSLVTDGTKTLGLYVRGEPVRLGTVYRIAGDEIAAESGDVALARTPAPGCPKSYVLVGDIGEARGPDADRVRFCARTIICRSFGLG